MGWQDSTPVDSTTSEKWRSSPPIAEKPSEEAPDAGALSGIGAGINNAAQRASAGITDTAAMLIPFGGGRILKQTLQKYGLSPTDLQLQSASDAAKEAGAWGTVGQIGADTLLGLASAPVGGGLARSLGTAAIQSGVFEPGDFEAKSQAAALGVGGAGVGAGVGKALGGLVTPIPIAAELLRKGAKLTPGQAGAGFPGAIARTAESNAKNFTPVREALDTGLQGWNRQVLGDVAANASLSAPSAVGREGLKDLGSQFKSRYSEFFPKGTTLQFDGTSSNDFKALAYSLREELPPSAQPRFDDVASYIHKQLSNGLDASLWKETIEGEIDGAIKAAKREGQNSLTRALSKLDKQLMTALPQFANSPVAGKAGELKALDNSYRDFQVLKKAGSQASAIKRGGYVTPDELLVTATKRDNPGLGAVAESAQPVFAKNADVDPNLLKKLISVVPAVLGTTEIGRKLILGQYSFQEVFKNNPELAAQFGRALGVQE